MHPPLSCMAMVEGSFSKMVRKGTFSRSTMAG